MRFAPVPDWIGRKLAEVGRIEAVRPHCSPLGLLPEDDAAKGAANSPIYLNGSIRGASPVGSDDLLFVATLNGQIASVMPAVRHKQEHRIISSMLQPNFLRDGRNTIELYAVDRKAAGPLVFLKLDMIGVVSGVVIDKIVFDR